MPIVIGQLGSIVLAFADTLMIGHHSTVELAAAAFVNNMFKKHFSHKKVLYFLYFLYVCNRLLNSSSINLTENANLNETNNIHIRNST